MKKYLPYIMIFHPKGFMGKAGPYVAIALLVAALPFLLSSKGREAIRDVASTTQQTSQPQRQQPPAPLENFNPLQQTGAWAITQTDADRAQMSWSSAKTMAADIWDVQLPQSDTYSSFYCGCSIERTSGSSGEVNLSSCGYESQGNLNRARRLEWEHIMPASYFGQGRQCWQKGAPQCVDSQGQPFAGRACCEIADPIYQMMSNDPVNLVPSVGEVNGDRSNYPFGPVRQGQSYGQCQMVIDTQNNVAQPPANRRGDVARVYAYMSKAYGVGIPADVADLYVYWMQQDPVSEEEIRINRAIQDAGHRANPFVLGP